MAYGKPKSKKKAKAFTPCANCKAPRVCKSAGRCLKSKKA